MTARTMWLVLLAMGLSAPLAGYHYLVNAAFTNQIEMSLWQTNGTIRTDASYGLSTGDANGGSVISKTQMPDGRT